MALFQSMRAISKSSFVKREFSSKIVVSASLNGVLTDPKNFPEVPVTPGIYFVNNIISTHSNFNKHFSSFATTEQMAAAAKEAHNEGASIVHIHFRDQRPGKGHLPCWDPKVAADCVAAIREAVPGIIVNQTTGTVGNVGVMGGGELGPTGGPISCMDACKPEVAALNCGSLNYLKSKKDGTWAWPPLSFDNVMLTRAHADIITPKFSITLLIFFINDHLMLAFKFCCLSHCLHFVVCSFVFEIFMCVYVARTKD
jgi:hypothetical protein